MKCLLDLKNLSLLTLVIIVAITTAFVGAFAANTVKITADHQTFDEDNGESVFEGNVRVDYQDITITSSEAAVNMTESGDPDIATFFNRPLAKRTTEEGKIDTLEADQMKIYMEDSIFVATGNTYTHMTSSTEAPVFVKADEQRFDNSTKTVVAYGNVNVDYENLKANSKEATLWIGDDGKARRIIFTGEANLVKEDNEINGERVTYMVNSGNLIAENKVESNVRSKDQSGSPTNITITSTYQQYDKGSDTFIASGNVKIVYDDYIAVGAKANFKLNNGTVDRILLTGRPSITAGARRVTADRITITTNPKHFDAKGNVQSKFLTNENLSPTKPAPSKPKPAKKPADSGSTKENPNQEGPTPEDETFVY